MPIVSTSDMRMKVGWSKLLRDMHPNEDGTSNLSKRGEGTLFNGVHV